MIIKSNCLLQALKVKVSHPWNVVILKRGSWSCIFKKRWPHFYWYNKACNKYYSYRQKDVLSWGNQLWYEGYIVERRTKS